jgi:hypothetical protein
LESGLELELGGKGIFFHLPLVPNGFPSGSQYVPQVPNT